MTEETATEFNQKITYKYDSAGRRTEMHSTTSNEDVFTTYKYNKNGLITEKSEDIKGYGTNTETNIYDFLGNHIYSIIDTVDENGNHDNSSRQEYFYNEFAGEYPIYEDGYVSPVNDEPFDKDTLEKQGYTVVSNVEEFVKAIAPGAKIIIASYHFNMSDSFENDAPSAFENEHVILNHNGVDGHELVIHDCDDLLICGAYSYNDMSSLVIDPRYSAVIRFEECDNLKLDSFTCGHTNMGTCEGNVIDLNNCNNVSFYNMNLFGCGVYGIGVDGVSGNIKIYKSVIHDCYYGAFYFTTLNGNVSFSECVFYGSEGGAYWSGFNDGVKITFKNCSFSEGETNDLFYQEQFTFKGCLWSEITRYPEYGH